MVAMMPHGSCFFWDVPLTSLHAVSDGLIALAYFSIPAILWVNRRHSSPDSQPILRLFVVFILGCGLGHLIQAWNIWHSAYWLEGGEKFLTSLVSLYTAVALTQHVPHFLEIQKNLAVAETQAFTDPLTGLANRRRFDELLAALVQPTNTEEVHTLVLVDLDDFKAVNDAHGHWVGDTLLCNVGQALSQNTRRRDTVARLGGDEFAVFLSDCPLSTAVEVAEKLRLSIQHCSPVDGIEVGASIGLALIEPGSSAEAIYQTADRALYQAKNLGKGQIWLQPSPNTEETSPGMSC